MSQTSAATDYELGPIGVKLVNSLGEQGARELLDRLMPRLGLDSLVDANARYRFGKALADEPIPVLVVLGRCIMSQAILHGATRR